MKKLLLVAVLLLGFSVMAVAQDTPVAELFGGYSYFRPDTSAMDDEDDFSLNMHGWNASVALNGNDYLAFVADFGGYYGKVDEEGEVDVNVKIHSIMFGPKASFRMGKVTPFVQGLFGYARTTATSDVNDEEFVRENSFAMAFGGGIDININDVVAIRPAQVEYFGIKLGGDMTNNFRYSAGIILKLGKR